MVNDETYPIALESIQESAQAQANLIEDLLDISRVVSGKRRIEMQPLDLVSVMASAVESYRLTAAARNLDLRVEDEPKARRFLEAVLSSSGARVRSTMPGEDGLALTEKLRTRDECAEKRTPALAVTALGFEEDKRRILSTDRAARHRCGDAQSAATLTQ